MIHIAVSAQRVFTVPASLARTTAHFRDFGHTLDYLAPHLRLAATYARDQYRMLYSVTEAGVYRVAFYCDIQVQYDDSSRVLHVVPLDGIPPVAPNATLKSLTGQGYYRSRSAFQSAGLHTSITYDVEIQAAVPKRLEWRLIPDAVITRVVEDVVQRRPSAAAERDHRYVHRPLD